MTRIKSERLERIQGEQYRKLYKEASNEGAEIKYGKNKTLLVYKSIGDDIDDFYDRIKMNKINFTDKRLLRADFQARNRRNGWLSNLLHAPHSVKTFHLSLLSDQEERNTHTEKTGSRRVLKQKLNFKNETKPSKKEDNYALSMGARKTLLCMHDTIYNKMHVCDVVEPDPWGERIKKNFEELPKQMEKIRTQEALEVLEYYQTHCESDSSDNFDSN